MLSWSSYCKCQRKVDELCKSRSVIYSFSCRRQKPEERLQGGSGVQRRTRKKQAPHSMADLLFTTKKHFPDSKIFVNSVLIRSYIGYKALFDFNSQLEIMCHNFGVTFLEANCWVARRDLGRDGRHLNRRGVARLAALFEAVMDFGLRLETEHSAAVYPLSSISNSQTPPIPENGQ
ncbi:hypothetical protein J6590_041936 [Homalodisca vitripennis]|nr:hypothetical protein J6590_041936 [Homalodisca vitripennis]